MRKEKKGIKVVPLIMGLPILHLALLLFVGFIAGEMYGAQPLFIVMAFGMAIAIKVTLYKGWIRMVWNRNGPLPMSILVNGISEEVLTEIDGIIDSGKRVCVKAPNNKILRLAIALHIKDRLGFYSFSDEPSDLVSVAEAEMGVETLLLSFNSREALQKAITILKKRGWETSGDYHQVSNLISAVHTQSMSFT